MTTPVTSLAVLRKKSKYKSQEELGKALAAYLKRPIGNTYAQKKIAWFESGRTSPTPEEKAGLAALFEIEDEVLEAAIEGRAPYDANALISESTVACERSLLASCLLSRPRPNILEESYDVLKTAIQENGLSIAIFVPYSASVTLLGTSDHTNHLVGEYAAVRMAILEANMAFMKSLQPDQRKAVAVYAPKADASVLIPPVLRQFSLHFQVGPGGLRKSLNIWTPQEDVDTGRPIQETAAYSVDQQIRAWESFFGEISSHWIETAEFLPFDCYWKRLR